MPPTTAPRPPRLRPGRRLTALLAATATAAPLAVAPSAASAATVTGGNVDWGFHAPVRASFGAGFRVVNAPASTTGSDTFLLPVKTTGGTYAGNVISVETQSTGPVGENTEGGFVKLGYAVGGWPTLEPTSGTASGIWTRFGKLKVQYDTSTGEGTLYGETSGGFHYTPVIAPAERKIADLTEGPSTNVTTTGSSVTVTNINAELTDASLGLGYYPAGTQLDDVNLSLTTAP